jgi:hypothetical protein
VTSRLCRLQMHGPRFLSYPGPWRTVLPSSRPPPTSSHPPPVSSYSHSLAPPFSCSANPHLTYSHAQENHSLAVPALSDANIPVELPVSLKLAMELTTEGLAFCSYDSESLSLCHPHFLGYHCKGALQSWLCVLSLIIEKNIVNGKPVAAHIYEYTMQSMCYYSQSV